MFAGDERSANVFERRVVYCIHLSEHLIHLCARGVTLTHHALIVAVCAVEVSLHLVIAQLVDHRNQDSRMLRSIFNMLR